MRTNVAIKSEPVFTHEGGRAQKVDPYRELQRSVMTCLLFENAFYESGASVSNRIATLVQKVDPAKVLALACEARDRMQLRHVPLFLLRELARRKGCGGYVQRGLAHVIQRADEMGEFLALYWKDRKPGDRKRPPLAPSIKRGLAQAFPKFDAYQLAKYDRETAIRLRDVLFLCHPKPKDEAQAAVWKQLVDGKLESPDTWEVALSAGKDKKETFERLIREGMLGGLALLRNLRNMIEAGVDEGLIRERLAQGAARALPFRFIAAAKHAPKMEDAINGAMLRSVAQMPRLSGRTLLVIDTSGSMGGGLSGKSELSRLDAACGLAILAREVCDSPTIYATAGDDRRRIHATLEMPARHGFALSDAIQGARSTIGGGGIFFVQCLDFIASREPKLFDRVIVFTDEQDCDVKLKPTQAKRLGRFNFVVNISVEKHGVSYQDGWDHIDGWSERVLDYIREYETLEVSEQS